MMGRSGRTIADAWSDQLIEEQADTIETLSHQLAIAQEQVEKAFREGAIAGHEGNWTVHSQIDVAWHKSAARQALKQMDQDNG